VSPRRGTVDPRRVTFEGVGLHTGRPCALTVTRATPGHGIVIVRRDRAGARAVPASWRHVVASDRRTAIGPAGEPDAAVETTEHLLAALAGTGTWDALVEVDGPEVPILDGSALAMAQAFAPWGAEAPPAPVVLAEPVLVERGRARCGATPAEAFSLRCAVEFDHPAVGAQRASWDGTAARFLAEVAPARTFGFVDEVDALRRRGLAAGGSLDAALVFGHDGPLNPPRFPDEPARHKLLDAIGDLALLGRPLLARVELVRPGHALVLELVRRLAAVACVRGERGGAA
jgi:UDP-3-O-[3-hydroxymyristoyl] N-acetylglucosamine deacetylase